MMHPNRLIALVFSLAFLAAGCAAFDPGPPPLTRAEIVQLSKSGEAPEAIVARLKKSGTVLALSASDVLELRREGVAPQVLDYLQAAQIADARRQRQFDQLLYGPEVTPFSRCAGALSPSGGRYNGFFTPFC